MGVRPQCSSDAMRLIDHRWMAEVVYGYLKLTKTFCWAQVRLESHAVSFQMNRRRLGQRRRVVPRGLMKLTSVGQAKLQS
jgi:hypothetical protein